ncbi:MAG: NAD(P)/FAD-dependent oxidoreductase [Chloroflexota bacterium]|nr:NAD(P)/FAD-dependent oxidoreductase [Chloroflexota bacterium]MDE2894458.1 NAD(P)/FAD-dependent oxidoreductase [Chloroflexota bacterium]
MARSWDVIVVGAGPGGSTAAYDLAQAGASVLLLDRADFPRDKPCGGGVLVSALNLLPYTLDPVTEQTIMSFRVRYKRSWAFEHRYHQPLAIMTQRSRLDAYMTEQAVAQGADFRDGSPVREIDGTAVTLANGDVHQAAVIVAADGANGVVRRSLGLPRLRGAVALEGNASRTEQPVGERWNDAVGLELGSMPGGYGWVFPKTDHCNVGLGGFPAAAPRLRTELSTYAGCESFDGSALTDLRGHHLPLRDPESALIAGRIAFIGDAAGLVDPLSGEGIGNAIRSAQLAAQASLKLLSGEVADLSDYQRAIESEIEPELRVARQLQALFHQSPWPYVQLLRRSNRFWTAFCRIVRGESSYTSFQRRLGPAKILVDAAASFAERRGRRTAAWQTDS